MAVLLAPSSFGRSPKALFAQPDPLTLQVYTADDDGYDVDSTLIVGKTEAILVDAQFRLKDELKLADQIAATRRNLKAIIITHPDDDHYAGLAVLQKRFPQARIYMAAAALDEFKRTVADSLAGMKKRFPSETPDSLPTPELLPSNPLTVDGYAIEIFTDMQGDYMEKPANSFLWIPSLRAVIAGDLVFNGVHPWLAGSTAKTRADWRKSLERVAALHPRIVVAGHKKKSELPDSPASVAFMRQYLTDFEAASQVAHDADSLVAAMKEKYPDLSQERFLAYAAKTAFHR
jgi:glyoxylase-like metal-dependent hydrolase (beta-lactamase superfamily II)